MPAPGPLFSTVKTFSQDEFDRCAAGSGDDNPIHVDPDFSARTRFGRTVAHGMLLYSVLWGQLQQRLPGARQLAQNLMFPAPTFTGEAMRFEGAVMRSEGRTAQLAFRITRDSDGELVCSAEAEIALPEGAT